MSDRDRAIERLLRARADQPLRAEDPGCLGAETVAAWADGTMTGSSRERVEAHAADCARCQALLAAVVLTEPEPEPARSFWGGPVRWLVPLAAGATAVALWVAVPGQQAGPDLGRLNAPVAESVAASVDEEIEDERVGAGEMLLAEAVPQPSIEADQPAAAAPVSVLGEARERAAGARVANEPDSPGRGGLVGGVAQGQGRAEATAAASEVARRSQAQTADQAALPEAKAVQDPAPALLSPTDAMAGQRTFADRLDASLEVSVAGETVRWRLGSTGDVELSTDGGLTWLARPTGLGADLLAGAAPAARVCWLVGRSGTIVLTTDAETWRRIPFPEPVDLLAVQASDAAQARVTTGDGRRFGTTDGGATWTELAAP